MAQQSYGAADETVGKGFEENTNSGAQPTEEVEEPQPTGYMAKFYSTLTNVKGRVLGGGTSAPTTPKSDETVSEGKGEDLQTPSTPESDETVNESKGVDLQNSSDAAETGLENSVKDVTHTPDASETPANFETGPESKVDDSIDTPAEAETLHESNAVQNLDESANPDGVPENSPAEEPSEDIHEGTAENFEEPEGIPEKSPAEETSRDIDEGTVENSEENPNSAEFQDVSPAAAEASPAMDEGKVEDFKENSDSGHSPAAAAAAGGAVGLAAAEGVGRRSDSAATTDSTTDQTPGSFESKDLQENSPAAAETSPDMDEGKVEDYQENSNSGNSPVAAAAAGGAVGLAAAEGVGRRSDSAATTDSTTDQTPGSFESKDLQENSPAAAETSSDMDEGKVEDYQENSNSGHSSVAAAAAGGAVGLAAAEGVGRRSDSDATTDATTDQTPRSFVSDDLQGVSPAAAETSRDIDEGNLENAKESSNSEELQSPADLQASRDIDRQDVENFSAKSNPEDPREHSAVPAGGAIGLAAADGVGESARDGDSAATTGATSTPRSLGDGPPASPASSQPRVPKQDFGERFMNKIPGYHANPYSTGNSVPQDNVSATPTSPGEQQGSKYTAMVGKLKNLVTGQKPAEGAATENAGEPQFMEGNSYTYSPTPKKTGDLFDRTKEALGIGGRKDPDTASEEGWPSPLKPDISSTPGATRLDEAGNPIEGPTIPKSEDTKKDSLVTKLMDKLHLHQSSSPKEATGSDTPTTQTPGTAAS